MAIKPLGETIAATSPFPAIAVDGKLRAGTFMDHPAICKSCGNRKCATEYQRTRPGISGIAIGACHKGVGIAIVQVAQTEVTLNGLLHSPHPVNIPRRMRKELEPQTVTLAQIEKWRDTSHELLRGANEYAKATIDNSLGMFHDVVPSVNAILRHAETYVHHLAGDTYDDKLANMGPSGIGLIKATELLQRRVAMMPLITNPATATFGGKKPREAWKTMEALVRTMEPLAADNSVRLRLRGKSYNRPTLYKSWDSVPFLLIENAIKYSLARQDVDVDVTDDGPDAVAVVITSYSPFIPVTERKLIWERGARGTNVATLGKEGSGLGLHFVKVVASANGFEVEHDCDKGQTVMNGVTYCSNTFSFRLA